jgi:L-arabonate dehydrase
MAFCIISNRATVPKKLARAGVKDMVRMSDCRMSGTAFGTIILHCCPESAVGGNLGLVENGDEIELDTAGRRLHLHVHDEVLAQRRAKWAPPPKPDGADRGYYKL